MALMKGSGLTQAIDCLLTLLIGLFLPGSAVLGGTNGDISTAPSALDFNRDIRPVLAENCFYCHGQDANKRQAELRLDVRDAAIEAGAIVPRDTGSSELVERINSDDPQKLMPPRKSNRRLSAAQKKLLERWISEGAVYAKHWADVTPKRPDEPQVRRDDWVRNPIDRFVLAKLETRGLGPSPEADRATLIKRLSIDLLGLPPSPEEVDRFVGDPGLMAYDKLVDRLLASPNYGERMALGWLDAGRYADSNGFQQDGDTWQWIWRDWVVRAMNQGLPFDQFTIWQLAGDLLPDATIDQKIASGFNRNHLLNGEGGAIPEEQRFVILFDRIDTTATTWLGLTMACAQCHDHKFDPITQRDYYSLLDAFNRVPESGMPQSFSARIRVAAPFIELPTAEKQARGLPSSDRRSRPLNVIRSFRWSRHLKGGERQLPPTPGIPQQRGFPMLWLRFSRNLWPAARTTKRSRSTRICGSTSTKKCGPTWPESCRHSPRSRGSRRCSQITNATRFRA